MSKGRREPQCRIVVGLDEFGWSELQSDAEAAGVSAERLLRKLVVRYLDALQAGGPEGMVREVPDMARAPIEKSTELTLELDESQMDRLLEEAREQEVPAARLAEHALFLGLAGAGRGNGGVVRRRAAHGAPRSATRRSSG